MSWSSKPRSWHWQQMDFTNPLEPEHIALIFEQICANRALGPVCLELRVTRRHAYWLVGTTPQAAKSATNLLSTHHGVHLHKHSARRLSVNNAARLRISGGGLVTKPERLEAALRSLYAVLASITAEEVAVMQLLIGRRVPPSQRQPESEPGWLELLMGALAGKPAQTRRTNPPSRTPRQDQHGAHMVWRLGLMVESPARAQQLRGQVLASLRVVESASARLRLVPESLARLNQASLPWRWPSKLRSSELVVLAGWPLGSTPLPLVGSFHPRRLLPDQLAQTKRTFATTLDPGSPRQVGIPLADAAHHTHVVGPTGTGKSTVLLNLVAADMTEQRGVLVIDPKGDLVHDILARVPKCRHADVVVLDPTNPAPVGFNPLAGPARLAEITADTLLATFADIFHANWGIRSADIFSAAFLTLARHPGSNLLWLPPLLTEPGFRRRILANHRDPLGVDAFWQQYQAKSPSQQAQEIAPVLNKLRQLLLRPGLRAVLGQDKPKFQMVDLFRQRRIVLVSLNKGLIGADAARLLGSLLIGNLWAQILARQADAFTRRSIVTIYIDEVQDFLAGIPGDLADALAQARSLGAAFTLAHQYRTQLSPGMQAAFETNTHNKIVFGLTGADATYFAKQTSQLTPEDFWSLPPYHAYVRLRQQDNARWFSVATLPSPSEQQPASQVLASSHQRFGVPARDTERTLLGLFQIGAASHYDQPTPEQPIGRKRR